MPISTFFGLQTSLRGLLAQQRSLDVTAHNIANANTEGYTPPGGGPRHRDAVHDRLPARSRAAPARSSAGRRRPRVPPHPRRVPRPAVPRPEHGARRADDPADGLTSVEDPLAEPGDDGDLRPAGQVLGRLGRPRVQPDRRRRQGRRARPARRRWPARSRTSTASLGAVAASRRRRVRVAHAGAGGDVGRLRQPSSRRSTRRSSAPRPSGAQPNDLLDRRDLAARQAVRARRRCRSTDTAATARIDVAFGGAATRSSTAPPARVTWPQTLDVARRQARRAAGAAEPTARSPATARSSTPSPTTSRRRQRGPRHAAVLHRGTTAGRR